MNLFAKFLSSVFNPFFIALLSPFLIVYKSSHNFIYSLKWELFSLMFLALAVVFVIYGIFKGFFSDLDVSKKEERPKLFLFLGSILVIYFFFLVIFSAPRGLFIATFSIISGIFFMSIINRFVKASIHVAVLTVFVTSLVIWYNKWFLIAAILIPITAWSRIKTGRHSFIEVLTGVFAGLFFTIITYSVVKYLLT